MTKSILTTTLGIFCFNLIFAQTIVINEFCSSNSIFTDEDNETPDWIELYNNSDQPISLSNYTLSDDEAILNKWVLPDLTIEPKQPLLVFASGKDRHTISNYSTLIKQGDLFSYKIGSSEISADWKNLTFNDSLWENGASGFGFGDNDDATIIPENTLSVYVRKTFELNNINNLSEILLHVDYDDGFVAYLNGHEIARENLGTANSVVEYNQTADTYTEPFMSQGLAPAFFNVENYSDIIVEGTNVLCIQIHNNSTTSSDLTLIPFLTVNYFTPIGGFPVPEVLNLPTGSLHTNFKISVNGEKLFLSDHTGVIIDQIDSIPLLPDVSYGRLGNDIQKWVYFSPSTPNTVNSNTGFDNIGNDTINFSIKGGIFSSQQQVSLSNTTGEKIYYTTDGSIPNTTSSVYSSSISINKTTVVKALEISNSSLSVLPTTQTYIIETRNIQLPIISVSMNPDDLWDWNTGIYEMGPNAESNYPYFGANFWMDWEKQMYFEYFDENGTKQYGAPGGVKIFGGWSRGANQKSMALFARKVYGVESFDYPFFEERSQKSYKSMVLRNGGNDSGGSKIRDPFMTGLLKDIDIDRQAYQPTVVYLNGEYWGILGLREKVNEDFLENNHKGVKANEVDMLENEGNAIEGTNEHYANMLSYIESNNMTDESVYDSVCNLMDVENFIEYQVAQIYYDNQDWPGNNIKFWRPQTEIGKWRWIVYDTDFGYGIYNNEGYKSNTLEFALKANGTGWPNPAWSTYLLRRLIENETFKAKFINRFADRLNSNFESSTVIEQLEDKKYAIENEIPYQRNKWNNMWSFDDHYEVMESFASERPYYMRTFINSKFAQGGIVNLTVDVSDELAGTVQVNILSLQSFPWSGKYFKSTPVTIQAVEYPGYEFSHWEGNSSTKPVIEVSIPSSGLTLKAIYKTSTKLYSDIVINEINYNSDASFDCGDWLELYNTSESDIDLSNWLISDGEDPDSYILPPGTVIPQRDYLVICRDIDKFSSLYPNISNVIGELPFGLSSTMDKILLYNANEVLIDSVLYLAENPWPSINSKQTIALIKPQTDNAEGYNWDESIENGTPGTHNDYYTDIPVFESISNEIIASCFPNPMKSQTTVRWECNKSQNVAINIFDINGRLVSELFNGTCSMGTFEETWHTTDKTNTGVYFVQLKFETGIQKSMKLIKY